MTTSKTTTDIKGLFSNSFDDYALRMIIEICEGNEERIKKISEYLNSLQKKDVNPMTEEEGRSLIKEVVLKIKSIAPKTEIPQEVVESAVKIANLESVEHGKVYLYAYLKKKQAEQEMSSTLNASMLLEKSNQQNPMNSSSSIKELDDDNSNEENPDSTDFEQSINHFKSNSSEKKGDAGSQKRNNVTDSNTATVTKQTDKEDKVKLIAPNRVAFINFTTTISIVCEFDSSYKPGSQDWVAMYLVGDNNEPSGIDSLKNYVAFEWVSNATPNNYVLSFPVPTTPGLYTFRYFPNKTYEVIGSTEVNFPVFAHPLATHYTAPALKITPTFDSNRVTCNLEIDYPTFLIYPKMMNSCWIGCYLLSKDPTAPKDSLPSPKEGEYLSYRWVASKRTKLGGVKTKLDPNDPDGTVDYCEMSLEFKLPCAGVYEFRMYSKRGTYSTSELLATAGTRFVPSNNIDMVLCIQETKTVTLFTTSNSALDIIVVHDIHSVDPASESLWIGLFKTSDPDNSYDYVAASGYIKARRGQFKIPAPKEEGEYELRLMSGKGSSSKMWDKPEIKFHYESEDTNGVLLDALVFALTGLLPVQAKNEAKKAPTYRKYID